MSILDAAGQAVCGKVQMSRGRKQGGKLTHCLLGILLHKRTLNFSLPPLILNWATQVMPWQALFVLLTVISKLPVQAKDVNSADTKIDVLN